LEFLNSGKGSLVKKIRDGASTKLPGDLSEISVILPGGTLRNLIP
jgi:hypothetical protein